MGLALFDLDNTLIAGDSDHLWGDFLVNQGLVDPQTHKALERAVLPAISGRTTRH